MTEMYYHQYRVQTVIKIATTNFHSITTTQLLHVCSQRSSLCHKLLRHQTANILRLLTNTEFYVNGIPYNLTFYALHLTSLFKFCMALA
jgi:hypothetical protein